MPARDIDVRGVVWTGGAIAAAILAVVGTVFLLLHLWHVRPSADRVRLPYDLAVEGPALQSAPQPELAEQRMSKERILTTAAWVDDAHGIVRIPIATAMRLLVERSGDGGGAAGTRAGADSPAVPVASPASATTATSGAGTPR